MTIHFNYTTIQVTEKLQFSCLEFIIMYTYICKWIRGDHIDFTSIAFRLIP